MNGNYFGTAFAKLKLYNTTCIDTTFYVVYAASGGVSNGPVVSGATIGYYYQSAKAGKSVVGGVLG